MRRPGEGDTRAVNRTPFARRLSIFAGQLSRLFDPLRACPCCASRGGIPLCRGCLDESAVTGSPRVAVVADLPLHCVGSYRTLPGGSGLSPLGRSLLAFKDRGDRHAGRCLARLFAESMAPHAMYADAIVPVPPEPLRLRRRGFAPASWLAAALARRSGTPLLTGLLQRAPGHRAQRGLGGAARRENMRGAFALGREPGRRYSVVLVDDVVTSGATLGEAAACLEQAGLAVAFAAVLACADDNLLHPCRSKTVPAGTTATFGPRR